MSDEALVNLVDLPIAELVERCEPEAEALALLDDEMTVEGFIKALLAAGHFADAARALAHALPKREAVAWACHCARQALGEAPAETALAALGAAEAWVKQPAQAHCRAAEAAAEADKMASAAGLAALAAFWSGESIAPEDLPEVPPDDSLASQGVVAAVTMSVAAGDDPSQADALYEAYVAQALRLAAYTGA